MVGYGFLVATGASSKPIGVRAAICAVWNAAVLALWAFGITAGVLGAVRVWGVL